MLINLSKLDFTAPYAFAPPLVRVICATSLIAAVVPVEPQLSQECVEITFTDGDKWTCLGTVENIAARTGLILDGDGTVKH